MIPIMQLRGQQPYIPATTANIEYVVWPCTEAAHTGLLLSMAVNTPRLLPFRPHHGATRHIWNARVPYRSPQPSPMHP